MTAPPEYTPDVLALDRFEREPWIAFVAGGLGAGRSAEQAARMADEAVIALRLRRVRP